MAEKKIELERANRGEGCLGKAADDEPVFILRAQDQFAPLIVLLWAMTIDDAAQRGEFSLTPRLALKLGEAKELSARMRDWQDRHRDRVKVPD